MYMEENLVAMYLALTQKLGCSIHGKDMNPQSLTPNLAAVLAVDFFSAYITQFIHNPKSTYMYIL